MKNFPLTIWATVMASAMTFIACKSKPEHGVIPPPKPTTVHTRPVEQPKTLAQLQTAASRYNSVLALPDFEQTPEAVKAAVENAMKVADASLDQLGNLRPEQANFNNTVRALDDIGYKAGLTVNRIYLQKETSTNAAVRAAGTEAVKVFSDWAVGLDYRENVYRVIKAFADTKPKLQGEDAKLLEEVMRDYRRAGLNLPKAERDEVERLRKELSAVSTDFDKNITDAKGTITFTKAELDGVPETFLNQKGIKTGDDEYTIMANVTFHIITVMDTCKVEETRRRLLFERENLAREQNLSLLNQILKLRQEIAQRLGYKNWADYQVEPKMAKDGKTALNFLEDLKRGLQPKFEAELAEYQKLKAKETGNPNAKINIWDWRYYSNELKKQRYNVDAEQLRVYFPYQRVLTGMFDIYQHIFSLNFTEVEPPYKWIEDLKLYAVTDSQTGEPMGLFYLDMFPREGKYNHFAQFGIIEGKLLPDGKYQRPTVALICNFPPASADRPSLLSHSEVQTLFHEFGHAMHSILTRAKHSRFAGTSVPRDFVEAPSQVLENWAWDKKVLDTFAARYDNPNEKIPEAILEKLEEAKLATEGTRYRRQIGFGLTDLVLHSGYKEGQDTVKIANQVTADAFLAPIEGTAYVAYFGHLTGYDAGYYGYAWADAISADMATVFENAPDGYFDKNAGMRLRKEIYEPGDSRDVNISIRKFLGRERSNQPFLKQLGIGEK
ncbi:MAG: Zn-dependent oligopeptidase [Verrucomicrobia bacterium]|nr:Zn-dependent oligopeptidase [Verrucomicrobiota bacterium]